MEIEDIISDLKKYMYDNNITQKELAQELGISKTYLNEIFKKRKNPSDRLVYKFENFLNRMNQK